MGNWKNAISMAGVALLVGGVLWFVAMQPHDSINEEEAARYLAAGIELFEQERFDEAIAALQGVPAGSTRQSKALYYEGSAYMMLRDHDTAIEKLQEAQALTPMDPPILFALGVASYKIGNIKLARGYFNSVLAINPMDEHEQELWEQARGLVDIMARLDRDPDSVAPPRVHGASTEAPQTTDSTMPATDEDGVNN